MTHGRLLPATTVGLCLLCLVGVASAVPQARAARQPNIVLILADDVGREVLGCYGGTSYATPRIDRLASEGMRFEHGYVMAVCHPTRTTLLTGQYPFRLGHPAWGSFPRQAEDRTLANVLRRVGYATAVAGKWQLSLLGEDRQQPNRMGFDEYCLYGWHEGPWYYQPHIRQNGRLRTDIAHRYGPDVVCEFLIDFIERNQSRPFFAFYSMSLCHAETNDLDVPAPVGPSGRYDSYAEMVPKMDERVGRIVDALERLQLREKTLVIFLSDNGTAAQNLIDVVDGEYVYEDVTSRMGDRIVPGGKATLTDRGTRVPLILNWPGSIPSQAVRTDLVDASDILPSLAALAGAELAGDVVLDGRAVLLPQAGAAPEREWVFAEHKDDYFVKNRRWKLYRDGRFYDLLADPEEQHPIDAKDVPAEANAAHQKLQHALVGLGFTLSSE
jgi:arylsulfatase A